MPTARANGVNLYYEEAGQGLALVFVRQISAGIVERNSVVLDPDMKRAGYLHCFVTNFLHFKLGIWQAKNSSQRDLDYRRGFAFFGSPRLVLNHVHNAGRDLIAARVA